MGLLEDVVDFSCLSPVFYFLLGVCVTIYFMLLLRSEKKTKLESADSKSAIQFYLNIFVLNKEEALDNVIKNKMKDRPKLISGLASSLANNLISEDKFVSNIGDKMTLLIPDKLTEMGIKCHVEKSYAHGNFVCVAINIISADARKVIEKKGGKAKLVEYDGFLDMFGVPQLNQSIDDTLASIIGEKMQQNFPATLREKMNDKIGLDLKITACSESEQAAFFMKTLKELHNTNK